MEPVRDIVDPGCFVYYCLVRTLMYDLEVFPAVVPERRTVLDRVVLEVMEGLRIRQ
jgi:hypothetical protein